jgi:heme A synthase
MIFTGLGLAPMFALVSPLGFFGDNDRRGCLVKVLFGLLIGLSCVAFFILLIVSLPKLGFSHQATSAIVLTIAILALLLLQPKAYRHFCRYELDLEKSEE